MKLIQLSITAGLLQLFSFNSSGSHIPGAFISYSSAGSNQYEINVTLYRDCSGILLPDSVIICVSSVQSNFNDSIRIGTNGNSIILPDFPLLPPQTSSCFGGSGHGISKSVYSGIINLPIVSDDWVVSFTSPIHPNFGTIPNPFELSMNIYTRIDNLNYPNNNSIVTGADPDFLYCIAQDAWEDLSITDPDGDSLYFTLVPTLVDSSICPPQPYFYGSQYYSPVSSSVPYYIDPENGWIHFIPNMVQVGYLSIKINEYRNGNLINETTLSFIQSVVIGCTSAGIMESDFSNIQIFPNPTNELVHINTGIYNCDCRLQIINSIGEIIYSSGSIPDLLDLTHVTSGIYSIHIFGKNKSMTKSLIIE